MAVSAAAEDLAGLVPRVTRAKSRRCQRSSGRRPAPVPGLLSGLTTLGRRGAGECLHDGSAVGYCADRAPENVLRFEVGHDARRNAMKLGLSIGYSGAELKLPVDKVQLAERLGFDSVWTAEAYGS